jgi:hypothetical protein
MPDMTAASNCCERQAPRSAEPFIILTGEETKRLPLRRASLCYDYIGSVTGI